MSLTVSAEVYRSVDEQGNVIFSDTPTDDAVKIQLQESYVYTPPVITDLADDKPAPPPIESEAPDYAVMITAPSQDETIRENAGNVTISSTVTPELNTERGDQLIFTIDSKLKSAAQDDMSYTFTNVDRGSHIAVVSVVDKTGKVIKSSKSILFHLQRVAQKTKKAN